ncbi:MAG: DUF1015 domain-containing protein [Spirochaetaceae bacterium]|nr:MAG: DUF1015 domain-containing protein [Spirochaetaceae bacterium]
MNEVRPFRALHYNPDKIEDIGLCLAQPYDVISAQQQELYYKQHPHNVIRLILNREQPGDNESENPYSRAKSYLEKWETEGVIRETARPSFWVYEQSFDIPEIGRKQVKGFIGLVRLQDYAERKILPHEKIMTRPLQDRVRLMRATETQFEYIWSIYHDKAYVIDNILDDTEKQQSIIDFYEESTLVHHRMWRLLDSEQCRIVSRTMEHLTIYIADGHHRYQAMLNIRDEMRQRYPDAGPEAPWEFIMMFLVNSEHEGLTVLPTHRTLFDLKFSNLSDLHLSILEHFHVKSYSFNGTSEGEVRKRWLRDLRDVEPGVHKFGALITKLNRYFLITLKDSEAYEEMVDIAYSSEWKLLDVNILNTLILQRIVGLTEEQLSAQTNVAYTKDLEAALESVRGGRMQVALILNATRLRDIITIAENDERMPRKSTHFYPKPLSGLVFFPMEYTRQNSGG